MSTPRHFGRYVRYREPYGFISMNDNSQEIPAHKGDLPDLKPGACVRFGMFILCLIKYHHQSIINHIEIVNHDGLDIGGSSYKQQAINVTESSINDTTEAINNTTSSITNASNTETPPIRSNININANQSSIPIINQNDELNDDDSNELKQEMKSLKSNKAYHHNQLDEKEREMSQISISQNPVRHARNVSYPALSTVPQIPELQTQSTASSNASFEVIVEVEAYPNLDMTYKNMDPCLISEWIVNLDKKKLKKYSQKLFHNLSKLSVDGKSLKLFTENGLRSLGIDSATDRQFIHKKIRSSVRLYKGTCTGIYSRKGYVQLTLNDGGAVVLMYKQDFPADCPSIQKGYTFRFGMIYIVFISRSPAITIYDFT